MFPLCLLFHSFFVQRTSPDADILPSLIILLQRTYTTLKQQHQLQIIQLNNEKEELEQKMKILEKENR